MMLKLNRKLNRIKTRLLTGILTFFTAAQVRAQTINTAEFSNAKDLLGYALGFVCLFLMVGMVITGGIAWTQYHNNEDKAKKTLIGAIGFAVFFLITGAAWVAIGLEKVKPKF